MPTSDGYTKVSWVSTIANTAAPTTSELGAGVSLEAVLPPDGLDVGYDQANYDTSTLTGTHEQGDWGRVKVEPKLTLLSDNKADTAWTTFASNPSGYLVIRRGVAVGTGWTSAQKVEVVPCKAGIRKPANTAANEATKFEIGFQLNGAPQQAATIA